MTTLAFILYAEYTFTPLIGQEENVIVRINKDGSGFKLSTNRVNEFSPGYYSILLTDEELICEQYTVVEVSCEGAETRAYCYTPDVSDVAKKVWEYQRRLLTAEIPEIIIPDNEIEPPEPSDYINPNISNVINHGDETEQQESIEYIYPNQ